MSSFKEQSSSIYSLPCSSTQEIVETQKKNLVAAINEASRAEEKRIQKLELVKSQSRKAELEVRFERERIEDQTKIQNLSKDLKSIREAVKSGTLDNSRILHTGSGKTTYRHTCRHTFVFAHTYQCVLNY